MEPRKYYLITPLAYTGAASSFTYHSEVALAPGQIVQIPIGRRQVLGVVEAKTTRPSFTTKAVARTLDLPPVPPTLQRLAHWLSGYYAASPSSVWSAMLPTGLAKQRRSPKTQPAADNTSDKADVVSDSLTGNDAHRVRQLKEGLSAAVPPLTPDQTAALAQIRASTHTAHLLQGVTGSGKTRLYLELAAEALSRNQSVIILVPEITLTPQIVSAFEAAFGPLVLTSHSKLTEAQRHRIWLEATAAAQAGQPRIIVGPRSCLFMPTHSLGLIVVDECHESSYKQDQHPRYHAVTAAAWLARESRVRLILGSATPGLTELYLAQEHRLEHIFLSQRINEIPHAQAQIIDLRNKDLFKSSKFITQPLIAAVEDTMAAGRQTLLYLNRRGSASAQVCGDCGYVTTCPHCNLPLTFHADLLRLICHHCNFRIVSPAVCPECRGSNLKLIGVGTKRLEAEIERLFPQARLARLDRDSATLSHIHTVLRDLRERKLDIIIGTQMIAGGLDLTSLDTIGVISADTMLHLPDYTAAERTYQLLSQVSGRAGRGDRPGQIFIQTYTPSHPAIIAASSGHYDEFARDELAQRHALRYPPYVYLLKLTITAKSRDTAQSEATAFTNQIRRQTGLEVIGPAPAFIELQAAKYHWLITVKSNRRPPLVTIAQNLPGPHWTADLDPVNLL